MAARVMTLTFDRSQNATRVARVPGSTWRYLTVPGGTWRYLAVAGGTQDALR